MSQPGDSASATALIPAFFGAPVLLCGLLALKAGVMRKIMMHLVMVFALLGVVAPLGRLIPSSIKNGFEFNAATGTMITMMVLSLILLIAGVRSFIQARKGRTASE